VECVSCCDSQCVHYKLIGPLEVQCDTRSECMCKRVQRETFQVLLLGLPDDNDDNDEWYLVEVHPKLSLMRE